MKVLIHLRLNAVAYLALLVGSSSGGYAAAATLLPSNSVGSRQVINGSLLKADLSGAALAALRGQRGQDGLAGPQGQQGAQGPAGPQGAKGAKGDKGDTGPSHADYAHDSQLPGLPAGDYVVYGQMLDDNSAGGASGVVEAIPGVFGASDATIHSAPGFATVAVGGKVTVPFQEVVHLPSGGGIGVSTLSIGTRQVDFTAIQVGSVTP